MAFENVRFAYPGTEREILKGVSFRIEKGRHAALVGENGAGKSTIIKLLLGLYRPTSGHITVNGKDIAALSDKARKKLFSAVFQDFVSYNLTLRENIALGSIPQMADDEAVLYAADKAAAGDIAREVGLNTHLGKVYEDGADLSFGQWQRLAIARAVMADGEILILDEPTAALDLMAEAEIYQSFLRSMRDKTCLVISHRLGSARNSDEILVLSDGVIQEQGSHAELMERGGLYAKMFALQAQWYQSEVKAE